MRATLLEVLNVDEEEMNIVLKEMEELYIIQQPTIGGQECIKFLSPVRFCELNVPCRLHGLNNCLCCMLFFKAFADVALDVCTPPQVESIASALADRLKRKKDYKTCFAMARLYHTLGEEEKSKLELWQEAYEGMLETAKSWPEDKLSHWKEVAESEIESCGYEVRDVLGSDFSYPRVYHKALANEWVAMRWFEAPITLGPLGHTLSCLVTSLRQEYTALFRGDDSFRTIVYQRRESALSRLRIQVKLMDDLIRSQGIDIPSTEETSQQTMVEALFRPAQSCDEVTERISLLTGAYYPLGIQTRIERLYKVAASFREVASPDVMARASEPIWKAYSKLRESNSANDSLMILAVHNWKPKVCHLSLR
jgi:hypothetical protein